MGAVLSRLATAAFCLALICAGAHAGSQKNGFDLDPSLIPVSEIKAGGPPRDGIPAIYKPKFVKAADSRHLDPEDRVLGVRVDGIAKAFPVHILNHHEVVNDWTWKTHILVTYCPLCGSGMAFHAGEDGQRVFGVSGLLYNSDVLLYDHQTESLWSQILGKAVTGPSAGELLTQIPVVHTQWQTWLTNNPDTWVLSRETGYRGINYNKDPYRGYDRSRAIWFPVAAKDKRFHPKAWVLGIEIDGRFKAYPFEELARTNGRVDDKLGDATFVVHYKEETAWAEDADGSLLPAIRLFWFAWYGFHPDTEVFTAD